MWPQPLKTDQSHRPVEAIVPQVVAWIPLIWGEFSFLARALAEVDCSSKNVQQK